MERREFLRLGVTGALGAAAVVTRPRPVGAQVTETGDGPYGPLLEPDANGIQLPQGFTAREVGRNNQAVGASGYLWHTFPDGGATFAADGGGWIYVSNSEVPSPGAGGVGALRFDGDGEVVDAYRILDGTQTNCAGGPTPWGTWLSCEEHGAGQVWECDPTSAESARPLPALGVFTHEAAAVDPAAKRLYLTEDVADGRFYRFTPTEYPTLDDGLLEVAVVDGAYGGAVEWREVPDPSATSGSTRTQVGDSTPFDGGEGIWHEAGHVYFTTKGDDRVWDYVPADERLSVLYDAAAAPDLPLTGVDNITGTPGGDLIIAEDPGNLELVMITRERVVTPFLRVTGQEGSELAGPALSPDGKHLCFSSQRGGGGGGVTYQVSGPFRDAARTNGRAGEAAPGGDDGDGSAIPAVAIGAGTGLVLAGAGALWWLRTRRRPAVDEPSP